MSSDEKLKNEGVQEETAKDISPAEKETSSEKPETTPVSPKGAPEGTPKEAPVKGQGKPKPDTFMKKSFEKKTDEGFIEKVVKISRVSKVVKGGKNFSFSALVVTGDGKGKVGIGLGKSNEVVEAIKKGTAQANKSFIEVKVKEGTIPHETIGRFKASRVVLKPASPGTGVIAGGPVRAMCDAAGIRDILTKTLGSRNAVNVVKATENGFKNMMLKRKGTE